MTRLLLIVVSLIISSAKDLKHVSIANHQPAEHSLLTKADCDHFTEWTFLVCSLVLAAQNAETVVNIPILALFVAYPQALRDYLASDDRRRERFQQSSMPAKTNPAFTRTIAQLTQLLYLPAGPTLLFRLQTDVEENHQVGELLRIMGFITSDVLIQNQSASKDIWDIVTQTQNSSDVWPICEYATDWRQYIAAMFPNLNPLQGCFVTYFLFNEPDNSALTHLLISQLTTAKDSEDFKYSKAAFLVNMLISSLKNQRPHDVKTKTTALIRALPNDERLTEFRRELLLLLLTSGSEDCFDRLLIAMAQNFSHPTSTRLALVRVHRGKNGLFACSVRSLARYLGRKHLAKLTSPDVMTARPVEHLIPDAVASLVPLEDRRWLHDSALLRLQNKVKDCLRNPYC